MKPIFTLLILLLSFNVLAVTDIDPSESVHDALMDAMQSRALQTQSTSTGTQEQEGDNTDTCLWGGWISTKDEAGRCQAAYRLDVYNDPYIKNFGQTYDRTMSCGSENLFRCNPVIFGKAESGRDSRGYCVVVPQADSALIMTACREAARTNAAEHLKKMQTDPQLLAQYINQAAEIAVQCRQGGSTCGDFIEAISQGVKPALSCHQSSALFPYMSSTLSETNMNMIDQLTGSLGSEYNTYIENLLQNRNAAIEHNQNLMQQAIQQYSSSNDVSRMWARLNQNLTVHYNSRRRRIGSKSRGASVGRCLMYVKMSMLSGNFFNNYPSQLHARDFGSNLSRAGFTNLMETPGFEEIDPENAPAGSIIVYRGGDSGHIEVKTEDGRYMSDFVSSTPISSRTNRRVPIGIYVKIPDNIEGLVEVPNE